MHQERLLHVLDSAMSSHTTFFSRRIKPRANCSKSSQISSIYHRNLCQIMHRRLASERSPKPTFSLWVFMGFFMGNYGFFTGWLRVPQNQVFPICGFSTVFLWVFMGFWWLVYGFLWVFYEKPVFFPVLNQLWSNISAKTSYGVLSAPMVPHVAWLDASEEEVLVLSHPEGNCKQRWGPPFEKGRPHLLE